MTIPNPSIFRREALEYRLRNQGQRHSEVNLPRLTARRVVITLWIVLGILGGGGAGAGFATVPASESGVAIVTASDGESRVAVLVPADRSQWLEAGQAVALSLAAEPVSEGTIVVIEQHPLDAADVAQWLGIPPGTIAMLNQPLTLVWVTIPPGTATSVGVGMIGGAEISVGSRRAGTFLPLAGRFFGSDR